MATVGEWFDENVADFKALFAANPALVTKGQFQTVGPTFAAVVKIAEDELNAMDPIPWVVKVALDHYKEDGFDKPERIREVLEAIKESKSEANFPNTLKAFAPDSDATTFTATMSHLLWGNNGIPPPQVISNPTAQKVLAMRRSEKSACFTSTMSMARKFIQARGSWAISGTPFAGLIANPQLRTEKSGRQTVTYSPNDLKAAVDKIGAAISRGSVYVAGVLSGLDHKNMGKKFPDPEHYLLLFAFDGAERFIFWDSDAEASNLRSRPSNGPGFGMLRHVDGHFSTAQDQADFDKIDVHGDHIDERQRHRYQVYLVKKPLP